MQNENRPDPTVLTKLAVTQNRFDSPVLRRGLSLLVVWAAKELLGYELDSDFAEKLITLVVFVVALVIGYNNPKDKNNW